MNTNDTRKNSRKKKIIVILAFEILLLCAVIAFFYPFQLESNEVDERYTTDASNFIQTPDGARIHYQQYDALPNKGTLNPEAHPTLVLIHGSNMSVYAWDLWVLELRDSFNIIAIDMPGHGLTGRIPSDDYSIVNMVKTVDTIVNTLGVTVFYIAGNSMGGHVSWRYALDHPERLKGMILIDAAGHPRNRAGFTVFDLVQLPIIRSLSALPIPRFLIAKGLKDTAVDKSVITEAIIDRGYDFSRRKGTQVANAKRMRQLQEAGVYQQINTIKVPALILWGAEDTFITVSDAEKFHQALPNNELIIYAGIGHMPMIENSHATAADTKQFINRLERGEHTVGSKVIKVL